MQVRYVTLFVIIALLLTSSMAFSQPTYRQGLYTGIQNWSGDNIAIGDIYIGETPDGGNYLIGDVNLQNGATLTIQEGHKIYVRPESYLHTYDAEVIATSLTICPDNQNLGGFGSNDCDEGNAIIVEGIDGDSFGTLESENTVFTTISSTVHWDGIILDGAYAACNLQPGTVIRRAAIGLTANVETFPLIDGASFEQCIIGIRSSEARQIRIENSTFTDCSTGIDINKGTILGQPGFIQIYHNIIDNSSQMGISLRNIEHEANAEVLNNAISNSYMGVFNVNSIVDFGSWYDPNAWDGNEITGCGTGMVSGNGGWINLWRNNIHDNAGIDIGNIYLAMEPDSTAGPQSLNIVAHPELRPANLSDHKNRVHAMLLDIFPAKPKPENGASASNASLLHQNYPNPFYPQTTISYHLPLKQALALWIYNTTGQLVRTLVDQTQASGTYEVQWDGRNNHGQPVSSGLYFYRLEAEHISQTRRMLLLK